MFLRILGWVFLVFALIALGYDCWLWSQDPSVPAGQSLGALWSNMSYTSMHSLGDLWFGVSPDTLNLFQVFIQRTLSMPELWELGFIPFLTLSSTVIFGGLGLMFLVLSLLFVQRTSEHF